MRRKFTYKKADGTESERIALVIKGANTNMQALDITEFSTAEQDVYEQAVVTAHENFLADINDIGLGKNWRQFKPEGITFH